MIYLIIIAILIIAFIIYLQSKQLKLPNVYLVTGGVKTGKSYLSVRLAIKTFKKNLFKAKIKRFFKPDVELPILVTNLKLRNITHTPLTLDVIERKVRLPYTSVVLIDETSLLADSMLHKEKDVNEKLTIFVKLFGHYTRGGTLIFNTQSLLDNHFSFKRGLSMYLWIHSKTKLPFITIMNVREMIYSSDSDSATINTAEEDIEETTKALWCSNRYYKYYDCYCYSIFTDNLPVYQNDQYISDKKDLKSLDLVTLQKWESLKKIREELEKEKEKKECVIDESQSEKSI